MKRIIDYLKAEHTRQAIVTTIIDNILLYQRINTEEKIQELNGALYNYFVSECVQNDQYLPLTNSAINRINEIYKRLILQLRAVNVHAVDRLEIERIVIRHRKELIEVIQSNEFIENIEQVFIPCSEYSGLFQTKILRLGRVKIHEPIIDIGCGRKHELIDSLYKMGYQEVYGIDQYIDKSDMVICSNWFDFYFRPDTWGTAIAHMSFTNHFRRAWILNDREKQKYADKYMEILSSIKREGRFIYTPAIREIENRLDTKKYRIEYHRNMSDRDLDTVYIHRLL